MIIPTKDFIRTLSNAVLFAPRIELEPLRHVRLQWTGSALHAYAADRFRIGWAWWEDRDVPRESRWTDWGGGDDPWLAYVDAAEVRTLITAFRLPRQGDAPLSIEYTASSRELQVCRVWTGDTPELHVSIIGGDPDEPVDLARILAQRREPVAASRIDIDPSLLSVFTQVRPRHCVGMECVSMEFYEDGYVAVKVGDRFRGALQAHRIEEAK